MDESLIDQLLDEWEELLESNPRSSLERFIGDRLHRGDNKVLEEFQRKAEKLASIERRMALVAGPPLTVNQTPNWNDDDFRLSALQPRLKPIPGYTLVSRLGGGGFGEVWKAESPGGFHVALKFVQIGDRFGEIEMRSLEVIKDVRHPNLLAVFGSWRIGDLLIIATELADRTLQDRLDEARKEGHAGIPKDELLEYMVEAAKGIDALNDPGKTGRKRIQHRDIKPQNLLLSGGSIKVGDFGLARSIQFDFTGHTGSMTFIYAAPECFDGTTSNCSDQYSLAITFCHLRGGRLPFDGTPVEIMEGHRKKPPDLSMIPAEERPAVAKALAKLPKDRWKSCGEFVQALSRYPSQIQRSRASDVSIFAVVRRRLADVPNKWTSGTAAVVSVLLVYATLCVMSFYYHSPKANTEHAGNLPNHVPKEQELGSGPLLNEAEIASASKAVDVVTSPTAEPITVPTSIEPKTLPPPSSFDGKQAGDVEALLPETKFCWCPPGSFMMGTPEATDDESPVKVTLSHGFWLGETEVTQRQWQMLMVSTPWRGKTFVKDAPDCAATYVTHADVVAFCAKLTTRERAAGRLPTDWEYHLPTEAQWEYACRAGTTTKYSFGEDESQLGIYAWFKTNARHVSDEFTPGVGLKEPNAWGLKDMHGNVLEWCADWYDSKLAGGQDPSGPNLGSLRVRRGGCWFDAAFGCRCARRVGWSPERRNAELGFRVAAIPTK